MTLIQITEFVSKDIAVQIFENNSERIKDLFLVRKKYKTSRNPKFAVARMPKEGEKIPLGHILNLSLYDTNKMKYDIVHKL